MVDSLGRGVSNAHISVYQMGTAKKLSALRSADDGTFLCAVAPETTPMIVRAWKRNYLATEEEAKHGQEIRMEIQREYKSVENVCRLSDLEIEAFVLESLTSYAPRFIENDYFKNQHCLRPILRKFADNPLVSKEAVRLLCTIADTDDMAWLVDNVDFDGTVQSKVKKANIAGALVFPSSPAEWKFMEDCLKMRFGRPAYSAASRSLRLNGSVEALRLLDGASGEVSEYSETYTQTMGKGQSVIVGTDAHDIASMDVAIARVIAQLSSAKALVISKCMDRSRTRSLVFVSFPKESHYPVYAITLERMAGKWRIKSVQLKHLS